MIGLYVGSFVGLSHAFMQVLFPADTRYTGIAVSFSIGIAISGGAHAVCLHFYDWLYW